MGAGQVEAQHQDEKQEQKGRPHHEQGVAVARVGELIGLPALGDGEHRPAHADENNGQQQQEHPADDRVTGAENPPQDGELAQERPEGGRTGDGQKPRQEESRRQGHPGEGAAHFPEALARVGALDVPGGEEEHPLGQGVVDQVKHGPEGGQAADTDAEGENAHVFDAGVGEHALDVGLAHDEDGGQRQGEKSHGRAGRERARARSPAAAMICTPRRMARKATLVSPPARSAPTSPGASP